MTPEDDAGAGREPHAGQDEGSDNSIAIGLALGTPLGVAIALVTDNWGLLGIGVALGLTFGVAMSRSGDDDSDDTAPSDR